MRTVRRTLALHPQIWGHRIEPFALPAELQAHFYELFEGEPRGSRMRYNTIAKTVPLALPAELQAHFYELFEGEPRGSRMRYNTIAKTVPLALPAELQAHL